MQNDDVSEVVKRNPLKVITIIIAIVSATISSAIFLEDRYALKKELAATQALLKEDRDDLYKNLSALIKIQYEDQIMDLEYKQQSKTASPYELAKLEHLKRRIKEM